jgi:hypothetical protein
MCKFINLDVVIVEWPAARQLVDSLIIDFESYHRSVKSAHGTHPTKEFGKPADVATQTEIVHEIVLWIYCTKFCDIPYSTLWYWWISTDPND